MEAALVKDEKYKVKLGFTERELRLIRASLQTSIGRIDDVIISQSLTEIRKEVEDLEKQLYIAQRKIGK